ncbi:MAG TPA: YihY/virulence factor BrkB family protein [Candidatus Syntrophosphaera sp.]|nr:YihY/virulence factor BrkB family protein [Candidatus Syntrophosphaera sp.]
MAEERKKGLLANLFGFIGAAWETGLADLGRLWDYVRLPELRKKVLSDIWGFLQEFYARIRSESLLRQAGSLAYITIVGFVPFLVFILLVAPDLPFLDLKNKIFQLISNNLMPTSAMAVNNVIEGMLSRRAGFNVFSFIVLIISSYALFRVIRDTFDRILSMEYHYRQEPLGQLIKFFGTIILGMLIMIVMFSSTSLPLISRLVRFPLLKWLMYVVPFLMQFVGLIFLYLLMPSIRVRRGSLIRGAFWTTVVWVLIKSGFDFYIYRLTNFQAVYGVLAALPIFLMWIYVNWIIIVAGIVLVSVLDSRKAPELTKREPRRIVRLTLEMFSNAKLNRRLEKFISREELQDLADTLKDDEEQ